MAEGLCAARALGVVRLQKHAAGAATGRGV